MDVVKAIITILPVFTPTQTAGNYTIGTNHIRGKSDMLCNKSHQLGTTSAAANNFFGYVTGRKGKLQPTKDPATVCIALRFCHYFDANRLAIKTDIDAPKWPLTVVKILVKLDGPYRTLNLI